jgi:very-short-patch-repair endonuclease
MGRATLGVFLDGVPTTSVARTIVDCAEDLIEPRLADVVHEAEVRRLFDLRAVERVLARLPGRRGRHRLLRVLAAYGPGPPRTRNDAEKLLFEICRGHGLPPPRCNVLVCGHEADFLWPEAALVVEYDGGDVHRTTRAFHADRRRDRALAVEGYQTLRVTWPDLMSGGEALARQIARLLAERSR